MNSSQEEKEKQGTTPNETKSGLKGPSYLEPSNITITKGHQLDNTKNEPSQQANDFKFSSLILPNYDTL
jgi:hypothetical protein